MAEEKEEKEKKAKVVSLMAPSDLIKLINKTAGVTSAYDLRKENPTAIKDWIPFGSRLLDSTICEGKVAGIPAGRICEIAGEESSGKSLFALAVAKNAIKKGYTVVYICAEPGGVEADFLMRFLGEENFDKLIYVEMNIIEDIFTLIEKMLVETSNKYIFVWDSYAASISRSEDEGGMDATQNFAASARAANIGLKKVVFPLARRGSTLLILNQIREFISSNKYEKMSNPFRVPGGKQMAHIYSLRIWLFSKHTQGASIYDGEMKIGKIGRALFRKSRFRSEDREVPYAFTYSGDNPRLHDEELWWGALHEAKRIVRNKLTLKDGTELYCKEENWMNDLKDPAFRKKVEAELDDAFIYNFKSTSMEKTINIDGIIADADNDAE